MYLTNIELIAPPETLMGFAPIIGLADVGSLAGLAVDQVANGFVLAVSVGDGSLTWWRIRARDGEDADGQNFIVPNADGTRIWVRVG